MENKYRFQLGSKIYFFKNLADVMAKATPSRSGDKLARICALTQKERVVAQMLLSEIPLKTFLNEHLIEYETDEITRLIIDEHSLDAFEPISHLCVGDFRDWLLSDDTTAETIRSIKMGLTPEMVAAVSKETTAQ